MRSFTFSRQALVVGVAWAVAACSESEGSLVGAGGLGGATPDSSIESGAVGGSAGQGGHDAATGGTAGSGGGTGGSAGTAGDGGNGGQAGTGGAAGAGGAGGQAGTGGAAGAGGAGGQAGTGGAAGAGGIPVCGNGKIESGETCDPPSSCPTSCDDSQPCTWDTLYGSAAKCDVYCDHMSAYGCFAYPDGCCLPGCNSITDHDCPPKCGNGVLEQGEQCDGANVGSMSCFLKGFQSGEIGCNSDCLGFDTSQCVAFPVWPTLGTLPAGLNPQHIWGTSPSDLWVVGFGSYVYHWDGTSWTAQLTPAPGTKTLRSIWGIGAKDIWAVGDAGMVVHTSDRLTWQKQTTPLLWNIQDVWGTSPTDVFAAANSGYTLHYDGVSWTSTKTSTTDDFAAISGSGAGDVWAVGGHIVSMDQVWDSTWVTFRYNGSGWADYTTNGTAGPEDVTLSDVFALDSAHVWAVGSFQETTLNATPFNDMVRFWDGSVWTTAYQGKAMYWGEGCALKTVWAASASKVFVGGAACSVRYNGSTWSVWGPKGVREAIGFPPNQLVVLGYEQVSIGTL